MSDTFSSIQKNVQLYPTYQLTSNFLAWLPLFFLYFNQYVSLTDALIISSTYYFSVFLLEVPSGYLSDRFGRKPVLIASSVSAVVSYCVFLYADNLPALIVGQCLLAGYFALKSGSDSSLLYDSLVQLGRQEEYAAQEAKSAKLSMLSLAASGLIGGVTGFFDLRIPYVLSLIAAVASLIICTRFREPETTDQAQAFIQQLKICLGYLRQPLLLWIFCYFVLAYALEHIPAEFNQPYVKLLQNNWFGLADTSAIVSGVMVTISMLAGAAAASFSIRAQRVLGLRKLFIFSLSIQTAIVAAMSLFLHPVVLIMVMLRNFTMALTHAPMLDAIAPHISSAQRATYLSIQSLAGRLGFAVALFGLAKLADVENGTNVAMHWPQLSLLLKVSFVVAVLALIVISLASKRLPFTTTRP